MFAIFRSFPKINWAKCVQKVYKSRDISFDLIAAKYNKRAKASAANKLLISVIKNMTNAEILLYEAPCLVIPKM